MNLKEKTERKIKSYQDYIKRELKTQLRWGMTSADS